jgi:hypothetical protein
MGMETYSVQCGSEIQLAKGKSKGNLDGRRTAEKTLARPDCHRLLGLLAKKICFTTPLAFSACSPMLIPCRDMMK